MTQAVQDHFKLIIGQIKPQHIAIYWQLILSALVRHEKLYTSVRA
jgi:hypothetical protein